MAKLDDLFRFMKEQGASDLHLTSEAPPYLRVHGEMKPMNYRQLTADEVQALIFEILSDKNKQEFINNLECDTSYAIAGVGRFRCNIFMQRKGIGAVFRIIPEKVMSLEALNMPPVLKELCHEHKGLIVVTGPTGSGKSTTLAAMIDYINANETSHIITVEDPIEFVHENKKSLINQREVHNNTKSFANALKACLREDPDIILVGEMRDLETIALAMTAAETGHLVFGTLHTNTAHKTVDRIIDVFPESQQAQIRVMLSESLKAVVAQALLPNASGNGRVALNEVLINTHAVGNLIREGKTFQIPSAMQTGRGVGMLTFEMSAANAVAQGKLTPEMAAGFLGKAAAGSSNHGASSQASAPVPTPVPAPQPVVTPMQPKAPPTPQSMPASMPTMAPKTPPPAGVVTPMPMPTPTATPTPTMSFPVNPLKKKA